MKGERWREKGNIQIMKQEDKWQFVDLVCCLSVRHPQTKNKEEVGTAIVCLWGGQERGVFIGESRAVQRSMLCAKVSRKGNERKGKCRWLCQQQPYVATLTEKFSILNSNSQVNCILGWDGRCRVKKKEQHHSITESWGKGGKADIEGGSRTKRK
jgi:hypothetical protein